MAGFSTDGGTDGQDAADRYHRVLSTIEANTGDPQLPGCRRRTVRQVLVPYRKYSSSDIDSSIKQASKNGDIIVWEDRDGATRFTRTLEDDLRELIAWEKETEDPTQELIDLAESHLGKQR